MRLSYVSNAHPSRNITTSSAALVITAKTVTPTLSHQIGAPPVSFSSSRWYIGPTSLHLSSLCTCRIVQLQCGLIVSEHWMHFAELITLRHPIPPPTKLASAQGGRGSQTRNCIGVTLCTSSSPSSTSSNSSTCTSSCIVLHCRLPCNFPAPTCNLPLVGSYENWKTEYQLLDQNACYLKAKTK